MADGCCVPINLCRVARRIVVVIMHPSSRYLECRRMLGKSLQVYFFMTVRKPGQVEPVEAYSVQQKVLYFLEFIPGGSGGPPICTVFRFPARITLL